MREGEKRKRGGRESKEREGLRRQERERAVFGDAGRWGGGQTDRCTEREKTEPRVYRGI